MNKEEVKRSRKQGLIDLWYVVRVLTGMVLHLFLVFCVISLVEHVFVFMEMFPHTTDAFSHAYSRSVHALISVAVFAAGMAGASWAKGLYIRYILPEAMDEVSKRILGKQ